ncbi:MAG: BamA/TamA family outer membrane protein [Deltaproteobacteria bacterium]|nr:BamA/TamA family outer membrane protein [Deltaproteobacteria bacterium]MCX7952011.1 BamA/TamA family outer membrane protein [Deltaproteobacteria bacterium]
MKKFRSLFFFVFVILGECDGKIIKSVKVYVTDIFVDSQIEIIKGISAVKVNTKPSLIKAVSPAKEGMICTTLLLKETERKLRTLNVFKRVHLNYKSLSDGIELEIYVTDSWTITPRLHLDSQTSEIKNVGIQDKNFLGLLKNVTLKRTEKDVYDEIEISYDDKVFLNSDTRFNVVYGDKSEGYRYGLKIDDQAIELTKARGWLIESSFYDTIFKRVNQPQTLFSKQSREIKGQVEDQIQINDSRWIKYSYGIEYLDKLVGHHPESSRLLFDETYLGPFVRLSVFEPKFKTVDYFNFFNYLEDVDLGQNLSIEIFYSPQLSALSEALVISSALSKGYPFNETSLLFNSASYQFRLGELTEFENAVLDLKSTFYQYIKDPITKLPGSLVACLNMLASKSLDPDREFSLGGEKGLLGFKNNSLSDENIVYFKIELRNTLAENFKNLFSVGSSLFFEIGSSAERFNDITGDFLADFGIGLRFFFPDLSPPRIFRLDFALPVTDGPEVSAFQIRLTASEEKPITRSIFEEKTLFDQFRDLGLLD